jgi:hypothetical protein
VAFISAHRAVATLLTAACLTGCASPLSPRAGEITVTDAAGAPVPGAVVRADPIDPRHPFNISDYLRSDPGTLGVWHTGPDGKAAISLLRDRPTAVSFIAAGYLPDSIVVDPSHPQQVHVQLTPMSVEPRNLR